MYIISIEDMQFFAYHGHYEEEKITGNQFELSLYLEVNDNDAGRTDNLKDAPNYQLIYQIVKEQMAIKSHLLEHLAMRILDAIYGQFSADILHTRLKVSKINPAMLGQIGRVCVTMER